MSNNSNHVIMKNKKRILVLAGLCAAAFCTLNVQASNPQQTYINVDVADNHIPSGAEKTDFLTEISKISPKTHCVSIIIYSFAVS